jgi:hypothetical protein
MVVPTLRFGARREPQGGERFRLKAAWKRDDQAYRGQYAMSHVIHIQATGGTDFYRQVATFAYGSVLEHGRGAVVASQGEFRTHGDGRVEASLMYVANSERADLLPPEVVDMIQDYDPEGECILAMVDSAGEAACVSLSANEMGSTPRQLFEEAIKAQQHVPIVPGTMVRIKEPLDGIEPGLFVFLGEEGGRYDPGTGRAG